MTHFYTILCPKIKASDGNTTIEELVTCSWCQLKMPKPKEIPLVLSDDKKKKLADELLELAGDEESENS